MRVFCVGEKWKILLNSITFGGIALAYLLVYLR